MTRLRALQRTSTDSSRGGDSSRRHLWRSRWAAIGAAVAVTLGGGAVHFASADSSEPSDIIAITPVRILDTRDGVDLGLAGPFVSAVGQNLQVTGSVPTPAGAQTVVPDGATGVLLNVTVVQPTAAGFISVRPSGTPGAPQTSSLNFEAGDITPNAVFVAVPTSGASAGSIEITYDAFGIAGPTTDVLVDVTGYTTEAPDVYTKTEADAMFLTSVEDGSLTGDALANNSVPSTKISNEAGIAFNQQRHNPSVTLGTATEIGTASIRVPSDGWVTVHAEVRWTPTMANQDSANCQITTGSTVVPAEPFFRLNDFNTSYNFAQTTSAHRTFPVSSADNPIVGGQSFNVVCNSVVGTITVAEVQTTVHFFPTSYAPILFIPLPFDAARADAEMQTEAAEAAAEATD